MTYDGLGNRLQMTAAGLTTQYELDGGRVLSAAAAGNVTYYLYGLGPIGELTTDWNYSLPDGGNTPRQLVDADGEITFAASYTPWGDTLETHGTGRFTQGYFGGIMDAATGLIYVGNGQYYDPATGRFLTRDARPNQNNPYTPIDPTSALLGPLALLALAYGRKKSRGRWDTLVILLVLGLSLGLGLAACGDSDVKVTVTPIPTPDSPKPTLIIKITATPGTSTTLIATPDGSLVDPFEFCNEIIDDAESIILFGGSNPDKGIASPGYALDVQMKKWTTDRNDNLIPKSNWILYPGYGKSKIDDKYLSGKALQAEDARSVGNPCVIIIAYSAGTEAALMHARWRLLQGYRVRAIALLGPTFVSFNETQDPRRWDGYYYGDPADDNKPETDPLELHIRSGAKDEIADGRPHSDWSGYLNYLLTNNVDIYLWSDANKNVGANFVKSGGAGRYEYNPNSYQHFGTGDTATNDSDTAKKEVYDWIFSP